MSNYQTRVDIIEEAVTEVLAHLGDYSEATELEFAGAVHHGLMRAFDRAAEFEPTTTGSDNFQISVLERLASRLNIEAAGMREGVTVAKG